MDIKRHGKPVASYEPKPETKKPAGKASRGLNLLAITLLFTGTVLVVSTLLSLAFTSNNTSEAKLVDTDKYQAVFMNGGQVYFGKIAKLNSDYMVLGDIYYLRVQQSVQPKANSKTDDSSEVSLQKLGCELHGPQDAMVIKQDQVIFWENLKDDGQVSKTIEQFKQQNPNGLVCEDSTGTGTNTNSDSKTTNKKDN